GGEARSGEPQALRLGPPVFGLVEDRHVGHVPELEESVPPGPSNIQRGRHEDAAEPAGERGRLVEIPEAAEGDEIRLLHRVLRLSGIAQHAERERERHLLRQAHDAAERLEIAVTGLLDDVVSGSTRSSLMKGHGEAENVTWAWDYPPRDA